MCEKIALSCCAAALRTASVEPAVLWRCVHQRRRRRAVHADGTAASDSAVVFWLQQLSVHACPHGQSRSEGRGHRLLSQQDFRQLSRADQTQFRPIRCTLLFVSHRGVLRPPNSHDAGSPPPAPSHFNGSPGVSPPGKFLY